MSRMEVRRYWDGFWLGLGLGIAIGATMVTQSRAQTMTTIESPGEPCTCGHNGKTWPCRKAVGDPGQFVLAVNRCTGGSYRLECPADKALMCQYVVEPTVCTQQISNVCWAADEPK